LSLRERIKENSREININDIKNQIIQIINVEKRSEIEDFVKEQLSENYDISLDKYERDKLINDIVKELSGYGALDNLIDDSSITAVFVNSYDSIYVEKNEKVYKTKIIITNLEKVIERMAADCGGGINKNNPIFEGMLPNGSRITAMIPPMVKSPILTIKKYHYKNADFDNLVKSEFMNDEIAKFLTSCIKAKKNIVINGIGNSGKTTLANALIAKIDDNERIALIEDYSEILLTQDNYIRCKNEENILTSVLKMLPDRIIIDSCKNTDEINYLVDAGYKGLIITLSKARNEDISIDNSVIIHVKQISDGSRKIVSVFDKTEIFRYKECYIENEEIKGEFETVSKVPKYKEEIVPTIKKVETISSRFKKDKENEI